MGEGDRCFLALHGLPGSARDWRWLGPCLEPSARLVRLDLPGFGESDASLAPMSINGQVAHAIAMIEHLQLERPILLGHSFGTATALKVAAEMGERLGGVALVAPIGLRPHREFRNIPWPRGIAAGLDIPLVDRWILKTLRKGFEKAGFPPSVTDAQITATMRLIASHRFEEMALVASRVKVPVWAAYARDDRLVEPAIPEEILPLLPEGPRLAFDTGGHNLQKSQAVELGESLLAWAATL